MHFAHEQVPQIFLLLPKRIHTVQWTLVEQQCVVQCSLQTSLPTIQYAQPPISFIKIEYFLASKEKLHRKIMQQFFELLGIFNLVCWQMFEGERSEV